VKVARFPVTAINAQYEGAMRKSASICSLAGMFLPIGLQAGPKVNASFSIVIAGAQEPVKVGSEVKVEIVLKNTSDHELTIGKTNAVSQAEFHYLVEVRDDQGRSAPDTEYGRRVFGRETKKRTILYWGEAYFTLKPNQTLEDEAVASKLYDMSRPGKYLIQVSRVVPKELVGGVVKSNAVTVTVKQ
jgi:hypothetical protein